VTKEVNEMDSEEPNGGYREERRGKPYRARLPGFVSDQDVGLGDAIKRATSTVGIRPCGGCDRRAAALNRWLVFSGRRQ
jgi:hypothetical protein